VVENGRTISIEYTLKLDDGSTADTNVGEDPLTFVQGDGEILEALEAALAGLEVDDEKEVRIAADQGYGPVDPDAFDRVELDAIPADARQVGAMLVAEDEDGNQQSVRVHEVGAEESVLDLNHPLAGHAQNFANIQEIQSIESEIKEAYKEI
jgi:FKBP-type peptidyl-prolyl cis-trans isomerase 2